MRPEGERRVSEIYPWGAIAQVASFFEQNAGLSDQVPIPVYQEE